MTNDEELMIRSIRHHVHHIMDLATTIPQQPPSQRRFGCQKITTKSRHILAIVSQLIDANPD